jgi:TRAP-type C4-dicarboxylate transport system substrate-binding protein
VRLLKLLAGALLLLQPVATRAQTIWDMPTEYPQNAMPGLGLTTFTKHVAELSAAKLQIRPSFDATAGIKSAGMLAAIADGRVQPAMPLPAPWNPKTRSSPCPRCRFW